MDLFLQHKVLKYDRETMGDTSKHLGNCIALSHPNGFYSYYGHLMQNSVQVEVGESVEIGQLIDFVGSSGNSTDLICILNCGLIVYML